MQFKIKGHGFEAVDIAICAIPLFAALILTFLVALQPNADFSNGLDDKGQFIVMPRNCYLKIP